LREKKEQRTGIRLGHQEKHEAFFCGQSIHIDVLILLVLKDKRRQNVSDLDRRELCRRWISIGSRSNIFRVGQLLALALGVVALVLLRSLDLPILLEKCITRIDE
jgi:hypothetical protein